MPDMNRLITPYHHTSPDYDLGFQTFLTHTTQKLSACNAILAATDKGHLQTLLDIGAAEGTLTGMIANNFDNIYIIEPNDVFAAQAAHRFPPATVICKNIEDVPDDGSIRADVILVAHVLYHIQPKEWGRFFQAASRFLKDDGQIIVLLQHQDTDYMHIFDALGVAHTNLDFAVGQNIFKTIGLEVTEFRRVSAHVHCLTDEDLVTVGAFQLNCIPEWRPMQASALLSLTQKTIGQSSAPYKIDCSQDFLVLRKKSTRHAACNPL